MSEAKIDEKVAVFFYSRKSARCFELGVDMYISKGLRVAKKVLQAYKCISCNP